MIKWIFDRGRTRLVSGLILLFTLTSLRVSGQTTVLFEGFEGLFPGSWVVGDSNALGATLYWDDVNISYGTAGTRNGFWKGYCAASGPVTNNSSATYPPNITANMSRAINLTPYSRANLSFSYRVPSLGAGDFWRVWIDSSFITSFSSTTTGWVDYSLNINTYAGTNRTLRFEFVSDASATGEGLYLDDIQVTGANAPLTEAFTSLALTNYTGYVIDSDANTNNANFNRESLLINTVVLVENFQTSGSNFAYQYTYRLRDTNGNLFPIYNFNGLTNSSWTYVATNLIVMGNGDRFSITNAAALRPAAWLNPWTEYQIEVEVARTNGVVLFQSTNGPYQFFHFTNLVSSDSAFNVYAQQLLSGMQRTWLLETSPGNNTFLVTNAVAFWRYDNFTDVVPVANNIPLRFDLELRNAATDALIPLVDSAYETFASVLSYTSGTTNPPTPRERTNFFTIPVRPAVQLDSVNATYKIIARLNYTNQIGQASIAVNYRTNGPTQLLHFNGNLAFGDVATTFSALANQPVPTGAPAGNLLPTQLAVSGNSGTLTTSTSLHYGSGAVLPVNLDTNGNAFYTGGVSVSVNGPIPDVGTAGNVRFQRENLLMFNNGAISNIRFILPAGFGWNTNINEALGSRRLLSELFFSNVGLNPNLAPETNLVFNPPSTMLAAEETKGFLIIADDITWDSVKSYFYLTPIGAGIFPARYLEYLGLDAQATNLFQTNMVIKRSNERIYFYARSLAGNALIKGGSDGSALMSATIGFTNGSFYTHFPYNTLVSWTSGASTMQIRDDYVVPGVNSRLLGVNTLMTPYVGDCEGCSGIGATNIIGITPYLGELAFTRDGGLIATTPVTAQYSGLGPPTQTATNRLAWGFIPSLTEYAQSVLQPTNTTFHMPGSFLRGADNTATSDDGPGVMLLTGVNATNLTLLERPETAAYQNGFADYAGINVRILQDNFRDGRSTLAGQVVNYKLRGNSKYYARLGGVSGIHSASPGTFPSTLTLLGYTINFDNYSLAYLDSDNVASRTDGSVVLPNPSGFSVNFEELKFTCPGGLDSAKVPKSNGFKFLQYWKADFEPLSLKFVTNPGMECDPGTGFLTLGVRAYASHVKDPLSGVLGFKPDGTLISQSDGVEGVDSRLQAPNNFKFSGANNTDYNVNPVAYAYYNKYDPARAPDGFINIPARLDVPFFEDLKAHLQTSARTNQPAANPPVYVMGGWPRAGSGKPNYGWADGAGKDFFSTNGFDPQNLGFPGSVTLANYRNNSGPNYHPRAVKLWLDAVELDYPMLWSDTLRSFKGQKSVSNDLFIIKVTHQLTYMDAKQAVIDFGLRYDGIPKISIASLVVNELGNGLGVLSSLSNAVGSASSAAINAGMSSMNDLLEDTSEKMFDQLFDTAVAPVVNDLYGSLSNAYYTSYIYLPPAQRYQFTNAVVSNLTFYASQVSNVLYFAAGYANQAGDVLNLIDQKLVDATNGIGQVTAVLMKGTNTAKFIEQLVQTFASQYAGTTVEPGLGDALAKVQTAINTINGVLNQVKTNVGAFREPLQPLGEWTAELRHIIQTQQAALQQATTLAQGSLMQFFVSFNYTVDNPFTHYNPTALKQKLKQEFKEQLMGTQIMADIQSSIKERVYDLNAKFQEGFNTYFQELNNVMTDLISQSLAGVDKTINGALGNLSDYMGAGQISGHAVINGDALKLLRIDAYFQWKVPEKMEFHAYLQIKELDSENTVAGCLPKSGKATEVTLGAVDVDLKWISPGLKADLEGKFVIDGVTYVPIGMGAAIQMRGKLDFGGFTVKQLAFAVAFGQLENYIAANCRVQIGQSVQIAGGVFFGRACDIKPIAIAVTAVSPMLLSEINPESIFGSPPFTGAFVYGEGTFPIWSVGCLFEVRVTLGAGGWYFVEGPKYGGLIKAGVGGTVVCILSASGEITMIGSKVGSGPMHFTGLAHVEGCFGPCPFCICVDTETAVGYTEGKEWDAKEP